MRILILLVALLASAGPAAAQQDDCARLAEALAEERLPALWADEADEMAEVAEAGRPAACLAAFDLIRPSPPTGPADLPPACVRLRALLAEDGLPDGAEEPLDALVMAIGAGDEGGCTAGLERLGAEDAG